MTFRPLVATAALICAGCLAEVVPVGAEQPPVSSAAETERTAGAQTGTGHVSGEPRVSAKEPAEVLEDGDGRYDRSTSYVGDLPRSSAVACYDGGVFVGVAPDILSRHRLENEGHEVGADLLSYLESAGG